MHTYVGHKHVFNYNPDLSGDVVIRRWKSDSLDPVGDDETRVYGEDLLEFFGQYIKNQMISYWENVEPRNIVEELDRGTL